METLHFKIAEACFSLTADERDDVRTLLPSYKPFFLSEPGEDLIFEAEIANGAVDAEGEGLELGCFNSGSAQHGVYRLEDGYKIIISQPGSETAAAMVTSADFSTCTISLFGSPDSRKFGLNNAIMIAFAFAGSYHDILLIHASVVMKDGCGCLFLGTSGTGKSTHAALWLKCFQDAELLNDDNPVIRVGSGGTVTVYGTPWSGKTPCYKNACRPACAFVRLEQAHQNEIKRQAKLQAFGSILSSCSTMPWDNASYHAITETVERVVRFVPVYYLKCLPNEDAALLCHRTVMHSEESE